MKKLRTPFGEIKILIDGKTTSYTAEEGRKLDVLCPHVLGRYRITVPFNPDGKEHAIACQTVDKTYHAHRFYGIIAIKAVGDNVCGKRQRDHTRSADNQRG